MMPRHALRVRAPRIVAIAFAMTACASQDQPVVPGPPAPSPLSSAPFVVAPAASVVTAEQDVYVSLPPDSIPAGVTATITNRRTGASAIIAIVAGGFDPVAIPAAAGDSITITVQTTASPLSYTFAVPPVIPPPVVVRTDPPPQKRDVPLNASLVMVFSQPIDATTLTTSNVQLLNGTSIVPGVVSFGDAQHVIAIFQSNATLAPNTNYQLAAGSGIRDTHGKPLAAPVSVTFTTGQGITTNTPVASVKVSPVAITLGYQSSVALSPTVKDAAGDVLAGRTLSWSSSAPGVATVSTAGVVAGVAAGTTIITVTCEGKSASVTVVVHGAPLTGGPVASVVVSPAGQSVAVGNVTGLIATPRDVAGNLLTGRYPTWTSSAPTIAMVSNDGWVTGIAVGTATITGTMAGVPGSTTITVTSAVPTTATGQLAFGNCRTNEDYCGIILANADGSGEHYLTEWPYTGQGDFGATWSPDGTRFVMVSGRHCGPIITALSPPCYDQLYIMNADGTGITQLTNNSQPRSDWSRLVSRRSQDRIQRGHAVVNRRRPGHPHLSDER